MNKKFLSIGALLGALAVIAGALGAHQLKDKITPYQLEIFEKGVHFQFFHALALLITGMLAEKIRSSSLAKAGWFFLAGTLCFSGSLYLLATMDLTGLSGAKSVIGPITPLGGLCFILGWILLFNAFRKHQS